MSKEYIEKEALLAQVRESRVNNPHLNSRDRHAHDTEHRHFEYMVFSAEPADVAPVVRGEWLDGRCTNCAWELPDYEYYGGCEIENVSCDEFNFCPRCGADMRKEANDE